MARIYGKSNVTINGGTIEGGYSAITVFFDVLNSQR